MGESDIVYIDELITEETKHLMGLKDINYLDYFNYVNDVMNGSGFYEGL